MFALPPRPVALVLWRSPVTLMEFQSALLPSGSKQDIQWRKWKHTSGLCKMTGKLDLVGDRLSGRIPFRAFVKRIFCRFACGSLSAEFICGIMFCSACWVLCERCHSARRTDKAAVCGEISRAGTLILLQLLYTLHSNARPPLFGTFSFCVRNRPICLEDVCRAS